MDTVRWLLGEAVLLRYDNEILRQQRKDAMAGWLGESHDQIARKLNDIDRDVDRLARDNVNQKEQIAKLAEALSVVADDVKMILDILEQSKTPVKLELQFEGEQLGMPGTETDTQTIPCSAMETDAAGNPVTLNPANVTWAIDNPAIASLTQNADGSATFKALTLGTANVTCTDNSVTPPLVGTDTLTVTAGPGAKLVLNFGTPA